MSPLPFDPQGDVVLVCGGGQDLLPALEILSLDRLAGEGVDPVYFVGAFGEGEVELGAGAAAEIEGVLLAAFAEDADGRGGGGGFAGGEGGGDGAAGNDFVHGLHLRKVEGLHE